ncbi:MAG: hypothetical protein JL50_11085 [Peptococcaceae bacterium BICA1-7]|nr:MAG: hypothetical protein JL50_11085 [Peptococcaceae bacterium BICA1-7]HBV95830.1 hypothetical protein [Desulfotomaculum sp.]
MEEEKVLKATHGSPDHPLKIGEIEIPCYVLEDGRRVLYQRSMVTALGMSRGGSSKGGGDRLRLFVSGKGLEPFISKELLEVTANPVKFRTTKGNLAYGYDAQILADICDAVLAARKAGALQKQQYHIAEKCEILMRGFARVGIIALVDEATGYQAARDRDELQKLLALYLSEEKLKWAKMFPDEYYRQLFRLRGWMYSPIDTKRPQVVGKYTNQLVYEKLPPAVLEELRKLNPVRNKKTHRRGAAHFQYLSTDIGQPDLRDHLLQLIAIMRISSNWPNFISNFKKAFPAPGDQLELEFDDSEE